MGMNIYTLDGRHIGKRYAAGVWCWTHKKQCIHEDKEGQTFDWVCPEGHRVDSTQVGFNPAFRELGFDKSDPTFHQGIDGASGFTWAIGAGLGHDRDSVKATIFGRGRRFVKTEYGDKWTIQQFRDMFKDVIIQKDLEGYFS